MDNNTVYYFNCKMLGDGDIQHGYMNNLYSSFHKSDNSFNELNVLISITRCQYHILYGSSSSLDLIESIVLSGTMLTILKAP